MSERVSTPDVSILLSHSGWLRRLAANLVRGGDGGDDAAQETWMAALKARPSQQQDLRPWLARVLQNNVRRRARTESRRRRREELAGTFEPQAAEPGAAALERLDLHRHLTELVTELDEPYRTTVVLRFFEEKSAAEIARHLQIPEGTVRWRTKEALDRLRARLDERHGDRKAWGALLLPLARAWPGWNGPAIRRPPVALLASVAAVALVAGGLVLTSRVGDRGIGQGPPGETTLPQFAAAGGLAATTATPTQIDGVVLDPGGRPLPGVVVTARGFRRPGPGFMNYGTDAPLPSAVATSGAGGAFRLPGLAPGRYAVAAAHHQHAGAYLIDVETPLAAPIELRLGAGGIVLEGRIPDEGGGPIAGAHVMAQGRMLSTFLAFTTASGDYRLVLPDPFTMVVTADGYAPARWQSRIADGARRDFRLAPGARVSGRVVADGRPVAEAIVRLLPAGMGLRDKWERQATSDPEGRFAFTDLPATQFRPFVRHGALVTPARAVLSPRAGGEEIIELALQPGVTVRGQVRDSRGHIVAKAGISVTEAQGSVGLRDAAGALAEVHADGNGRFVLEALPPGQVNVRAAAEGYDGRRELLVLGAKPVVEVALVLQAMSGVTGTILRSDGSAAANVEVRGTSRPFDGKGGGRLSRAISDASGRFTMEGLGGGTVTLTAWSGTEAVLHGPFPVQAGQQEKVIVKLAPGAVASGRVRWEDGRPAAGVRVRGLGEKVNPGPNESIMHEIMLEPVRTDAEGKFSIGPFLPGRAALAAFAPGERESSSTRPRPNQAAAAVTTGQQVSGLEMVISAGRQRLAGVTLDPAGKPLPGATVIAERQLPGATAYAGSAYGRRSISGGDGAFVIEGLSEGEFTIFGRHPHYPDFQVAGVRAGATDVRLRFPRPAQLLGAVATRAGKAVKDCFVTVDPVLAPGERGPVESDLPRIDLEGPERGLHRAPPAARAI